MTTKTTTPTPSASGYQTFILIGGPHHGAKVRARPGSSLCFTTKARRGKVGHVVRYEPDGRGRLAYVPATATPARPPQEVDR